MHDLLGSGGLLPCRCCTCLQLLLLQYGAEKLEGCKRSDGYSSLWRLWGDGDGFGGRSPLATGREELTTS